MSSHSMFTDLVLTGIPLLFISRFIITVSFLIIQTLLNDSINEKVHTSFCDPLGCPPDNRFDVHDHNQRISPRHALS